MSPPFWEMLPGRATHPFTGALGRRALLVLPKKLDALLQLPVCPWYPGISGVIWESGASQKA